MPKKFQDLVDLANANSAEPTPEQRAEKKRLAEEAGRKERNAMLTFALGSGLTPFLMVGLMLLAIGGGTVVGQLGPDSSVARFLMFAAAAGGIGWYGWTLIKRFDMAAVAKEEAWLEDLPFNVNVAGYLQALTRTRPTARVTVRISFVEPLDDLAKADVEGAMMVATDADSTSWNGGRLTVKSPMIVTSGTNNDRSGPARATFGNRRIHTWVRPTIAEGLEVVHTAHPIKDAFVTVAKH